MADKWRVSEITKKTSDLFLKLKIDYLGLTEKVIFIFIIDSYNEFSRTKCKGFN